MVKEDVNCLLAWLLRSRPCASGDLLCLFVVLGKSFEVMLYFVVLWPVHSSLVSSMNTCEGTWSFLPKWVHPKWLYFASISLHMEEGGAIKAD